MSNESKSATVQVTLELVRQPGCSGCVFNLADCEAIRGLPSCVDNDGVWKIKQENDNAN